jgi:hypothetical protein
MTDIVTQDGVSHSYTIIEAGEIAVGSGTVQLKGQSTPCGLVWVGAPTADHQVGAANDGNVLVGDSSNQVLTIQSFDHAGRFLPVKDAADLHLTGFNAGDVLAYMILG